MTVHTAADPAADPAAKPGAAPLTFYDVIFELNQRRAEVRAEVEELRAAGVPVVVPADALFLCELAGYVVDLGTGALVGSADDRATGKPAIAGLCTRVAEGAGHD